MQWALAVVVVCVLLDSLASDMVQRYATYVFINPVEEHSCHYTTMLFCLRIVSFFWGLLVSS